MGRRLFGLALLVLAACLAAGVPTGRAEDSPYLNVWVHYDYMVGPGYSDAPSAASMQLVVDAFKAHGVTLHIDPKHAAIPAQRVIVPDWQSQYASTPGFDDLSCTGPDAVRFSQLQAQYFQPSSNHAWHYAVFGDYVFGDPHVSPDGQPYTSHCPTAPGQEKPQPGMTGDSQVGFFDIRGGLGYSFVVAMQPFRDVGLDVNDPANARFVAGTFMHELGHNLGLQHGGAPLSGNDFQDNLKPNYISVMNYEFQFGIPYAATPESTTIAGWRVDYSDVALPDLNECDCAVPPCLNETVGLQDTGHPTDISTAFGKLYPVLGPVDWNGDGNTTETTLCRDLNGDRILSILHGADDWAWIHSRLTPPAVTNLSVGGDTLYVAGVNLMGPAKVIFSGGVAAVAEDIAYDDQSTNTSFSVSIPVGAKSGPVTIVAPEGKVESSQSITITSTAHGVQGIAPGPDGNVWFTEPNGNAIGRITSAGKISEFPLPTPSSEPWRIAAGPDGNMWFTERGASEIGRITPAGKVTEFPVSSPATGIATGPDGNLWFTEPAAVVNAIGRITPSGQVAEFPIPTPSSDPTGITAGPDGNVWFTETGGSVYTGTTGNIGRITSAGTITEFPVPDPNSCGTQFGATLPNEITAGADGNLWFTGACPGLITPNGAFTYLPALGGGGVARGPDGNVWFTESEGSIAIGEAPAIARITPDGTVTEFAIPSAATPLEIAAGPDGNLWFTEEGTAADNFTDQIGRITPSGQVIEFPIP